MTEANASAGGFPRSARVLVGADFKACFGAGQRLSTRYFRVHYRASAVPRLGLAVSRKVDRRAVARNRIKRIARDSFRRARGGLPALDLILLARHEAAGATNAALFADLAALWRRLAALKAPDREGTMRADPATAASGAVDPPRPAPAEPTSPGAIRPISE